MKWECIACNKINDMPEGFTEIAPTWSIEVECPHCETRWRIEIGYTEIEEK